jgi:transglutaminase-like putative cysteine protease
VGPAVTLTLRCLRAWLAAASLCGAFSVATAPARGDVTGPVLHEPIPPDADEDLAMHVVLAGNLPPAIGTPHGNVAAPDPEALPSPTASAYANGESDRFRPDRDTRRPDVSGYDDPFTPSTTPFKRLSAFDVIRSDFTLDVRDPRPIALGEGAPPGPDDDSFYGDMVVDVRAGQRVRIPSVGPGARIVQARLGIGTDDIPFQVSRDGADNWFLQAAGVPSGPARRARLVMQLAIPRRAFGGEFNDPGWSDLPLVAPLPDRVARDAAIVRAAIGVSRQMRPREAIAKLVQYFRSFADSNDLPHGRGSVYLDLALSKKGVCRHRAFAFLVTAQSLGIPSRMVVNEAHAWVEVNDGELYRRIDLGGAGRMDSGAPADRAVYTPPADAFRWPPGAKRGEDMVAEPRGAGGGTSASSRAEAPGGAASTSAPSAPSSKPTSPALRSAAPGSDGASVHGSRVLVRVDVVESVPHRGDPLHVRGTVTGTGTADGERCDHERVDIWLTVPASTGAGRTIRLGSLATGDDGTFGGGLVLPADAPLGDYDVVATSAGGGRCSGADGP